MIGERLKAARGASGLSMRDLAERAAVSAMAISNYERNVNVPGSDVLLRLAAALDVRVEYFLRPVSATLSEPAYRCRPRMPARQRQEVVGRVFDWLQRRLEVEQLFPAKTPGPGMPGPFRVSALEEVERAAETVREEWQLGVNPIDNLTQVLEDRGIKVGLVPADDGFEAMTFLANGDVVVMVVREGVPGDRQRFSLAHELGHVVLDCDDGVDSEAAALRFAGAFLVPKAAVLSELGLSRSSLDLFELHLLKHKYGVSMQTWVHRASDLGVISESVARHLRRLFTGRGWKRVEPGDQVEPEEPERMKRLIRRALAEDIISESRAGDLLGVPLADYVRAEAARHEGFPIDASR